MNVNIIGVPIFLGSDKIGVNLGPYKLRNKQLVEMLRNKDLNIFDFGNLVIPKVYPNKIYEMHPNMKYLKEVIEVNTNLAHEVYASLTSNSFPFVIGGDHSIGIGSISGASKYFDDIGVIWVDAHGDINTEETSPSGNIHGMPLASAMGIGYNKLINLYYKGIKVKPENVFIIGVRELDTGEKELIEKESLTVFTTRDLIKYGVSNIVSTILESFKKNNIKAVHLSFDIDCIDPTFVPGTGTRVKNGMTTKEAEFLLVKLMNSGLIKSMDLVELNSLLDKDDMTADVAIELINKAFDYIN